MNSKFIRDSLPFIILVLIAIAAIFVPVLPNFEDKEDLYNGADITWILIATALVFLMTPGLAFFYGGMVHRKNVISTMIKSTVAAGVVTVIWVTFGYSLCFGESMGGFIGNPMTHFFFKDVNNTAPWSLAPTIPKTLFSLFNTQN
jgi:Amt family ammonium transporter